MCFQRQRYKNTAAFPNATVQMSNTMYYELIKTATKIGNFANRRIFPIFVASFYHRIAHNGILTAPPGFVRAGFCINANSVLSFRRRPFPQWQ